MAAVLLMVGRGLEQPSVVQRMLDIETTRQKPQYNMAAEVLLISHLDLPFIWCRHLRVPHLLYLSPQWRRM